MLDVVGADVRVPLADGREVPYANLDQAASAPCLRGVAAHVERVLPYSASVRRGTGYSCAVCTALYEGARHAVRAFVGGRPDDMVVFTRNATDSVNLLARCLPSRPEGSPRPENEGGAGEPAGPAAAGGVVVFDLEYHANLLPWRARPGCRWVPVESTRAGTLYALAAALDAGELHRHEELLRRRLVAGLNAIEGVTIHTLWADGAEPAHQRAEAPVGVVTFSVAGHDPGFVAAVLSAEHGVGVRAGRFCAHPLLARLGAARGAIRAGVGVGSTSTDVDRLLAGLTEIVGRGPRQQYRQLSDGGWVPASDGRVLPRWVAEHVAAGLVPGQPPAPGGVHEPDGLPVHASPCGS